MPFAWLHPALPETLRAQLPTAQREMHERDVRERAGLLLRLGRSEAQVVALLQAQLEWEFQGLPRPAALSQLEGLVAAVFARHRGTSQSA